MVNNDNILKFKNCFNELFGDSYSNNYLIEIEDTEYETVLSANREGMLLLIKALLMLCEANKEWSHYHLDEAGAAYKCNKPMVISLIKED